MTRHWIAFVLWIALLVGALPQAAHAESIAAVYDEPPDTSRCSAGVLAESERQSVLSTVNRIRRLHGLAPVVYAPESDIEVMQSSLIIAANNEITHFPAESSDCFSEEGADGAAASNLAWSYPTDASGDPLLAPSGTDVRNWLIDPGVPDLGHRRWLLDPFLQEVAYGRVDAPPVGGDPTKLAHGAALKVQSDINGVSLDPSPAFVGYPYGDYPIDLFELGWYWSFSLVASPTDYWANAEVDFSDATVSVQGSDGQLTVRDVSSSDAAVGLPNLLQWQVDDAQINQRYVVEIKGVRVQGETRSYRYTVRLVPPDLMDLEIPVHTVDAQTRVLDIRAGQEFAIYAPPPMQIPDRYTISRRQMSVQMVEHSPYVRMFRVDGTIGDEVVLPFAENPVTLRITETADGVRNPLFALRRDLGMPVYKFSATGAVFSATQGSQFAIYIPPTSLVKGAQRVEWTQSAGSRFSIEFYSSRVLLVSIESGAPGDEATVSLGADSSFKVQVRVPR